MAQYSALITLTVVVLMLGCDQKKEQVGPADAKWVEVGENRTTLYVDPYNIYRKGDRVKMWHLKNHKTTQTSEVTGDFYLSSLSQREYDCVEERIRVLSFTLFSDNMGSGKVVYFDSSEGEWVPVEPESINQNSWKLACKKQ